MANTFTARSMQRLIAVHPDLQKLMNAAIKTSTIPFQISQGLRTEKEQAALYAQGRTKPGPIVTWTMNSKHLTGNAVDVAIIIGGKYITDEKLYIQLANHIIKVAADLKIKITWGGNWKKGRDLPHYERG